MHQKGFTLIELLVVISIISLMSGVVLSSLGAAREKARIAAGLRFESSMHNAYAANAIGLWEMDEGSGSVVQDLSGNGFSGAFASTPTWTDGIRRGALNFGSPDQISLPASFGGRTDLVGGQNGELLFMAWIRPTSFKQNGYNMIAVNFPGFRYLGVNPSRRLQLMVRDVANNVNFWPQSARTIPLDKWTHVAFLFEGGVGYKFYIDGKVDREVENDDLGIVAQGTPSISGTVSPSEYWEGDIDSVRFYRASFD